jgi:hypothetical protein
VIEIFGILLDKTTHDTFSIQWNARRASFTPTDSVGNYNFTVLFSEDPVSDFSVVNNTIIDGATGPFLITPTLKDYNRNRDRYFKVRATNKVNPATIIDSNSISINDEYDGVISTIQYAESLLNDLYIGESVYVSKRKVDGDRCPECWNPYQFRRTKTNCNTCRGTGFSDGFYKPINATIAIDTNPRVAEQSQTGEIQVTTIKGRMSGFPLVAPRDLIVVKSTNDRFTVMNVDYTKLPNLACSRGQYSGDGHIISQILNLSQLNPDDPKFGVVMIGTDIKGGGDLSAQLPEVSNA